ncbi:MAG: hypothetical protein LBH37_03085 [Oscillospiraceae bacterium]|jgi:hypothetical protein|nr:hypothetical protein [Oscillospiraceae bacterium]
MKKRNKKATTLLLVSALLPTCAGFMGALNPSTSYNLNVYAENSNLQKLMAQKDELLKKRNSYQELIKREDFFSYVSDLQKKYRWGLNVKYQVGSEEEEKKYDNLQDAMEAADAKGEPCIALFPDEKKIAVIEQMSDSAIKEYGKNSDGFFENNLDKIIEDFSKQQDERDGIAIFNLIMCYIFFENKDLAKNMHSAEKTAYDSLVNSLKSKGIISREDFSTIYPMVIYHFNLKKEDFYNFVLQLVEREISKTTKKIDILNDEIETEKENRSKMGDGDLPDGVVGAKDDDVSGDAQSGKPKNPSNNNAPQNTQLGKPGDRRTNGTPTPKSFPPKFADMAPMDHSFGLDRQINGKNKVPTTDDHSNFNIHMALLVISLITASNALFWNMKKRENK